MTASMYSYVKTIATPAPATTTDVIRAITTGGRNMLSRTPAPNDSAQLPVSFLGALRIYHTPAVSSICRALHE